MNAFRILQLSKKNMLLFSSPLSVDTDDAPHQQQLELIELHCDNELHSWHQQLSLVNFYWQLDKGRFPEMWTFAKKMLSFFGSTYLCEQTSSVINWNKNCLRSRLSDSHLRDILHISTTALKPNLAYLLHPDLSINLLISVSKLPISLSDDLIWCKIHKF